MSPIRRPLFGSILLAALLVGAPTGAVEQTPTGSASGLPVPRFVSLKSDRVHVRGGPSREHDVAWLFTRAGLPVEVTAEFDNWRRIRDWEGAEGWVYHSLLSGKRTALVAARPKQKDELVSLHAAAEPKAEVIARLQPGVVAQVKRCSSGWCRILGNGFDGWVQQERLWGVYANEKVD